MDIQTRSEETGVQVFPSLKTAMDATEKDPSIWKVSVALESGERIRLVKYTNSGGYHYWRYEPLLLVD